MVKSLNPTVYWQLKAAVQAAQLDELRFEQIKQLHEQKVAALLETAGLDTQTQYTLEDKGCRAILVPQSAPIISPHQDTISGEVADHGTSSASEGGSAPADEAGRVE